MFVFGLKGKALVYMNSRPKERLLRIQFPKERELVSQGCCNKITSRWPKTIEIYSLTVLEARSQVVSKATSRWSIRGDPSLLLPASGGSGCSLASGSVTPASAPTFTWPSLPTPTLCFFSSVCIISYKDACQWN